MTHSDSTLHFLLSNVNKGINLTAACFNEIKKAPAEEQPRLAEDFFILYKSAFSFGKIKLPTLVSSSEDKKYTLKYHDLVDSRMMELQNQELSDREFYTRLWSFLRDDPVFPNEKARIVAMFICASDQRMPYFKLDKDQMLSMDKEEYAAAMKDLGEHLLAKLEYILRADFDQNTEQASLIVQMMDQVPDHKLRCVLMSRVLAYYSRKLLLQRLTMGDFDEADD